MKIITDAMTERKLNMLDIGIGVSGYVDADSSWRSDGMSIPYAKLYYILSGIGHIVCNGAETELLPERVYLVPSGAYHAFRCESHMEKLYFHITATRPDGSDILETGAGVEWFAVTEGYIPEMLRLYRSGSIPDCIRLKSRIYETVVRFLSGCDDRYGEKQYSAVINKVIELIRREQSLSLTVKSLADRLFISESKLSKQFLCETGETVGRYIDRLVMTEAQRSLLRSDESVGEISERLGFCDRFYFSRKFRQYYGQTPTEYRKAHDTLRS